MIHARAVSTNDIRSALVLSHDWATKRTKRWAPSTRLLQSIYPRKPSGRSMPVIPCSAGMTPSDLAAAVREAEDAEAAANERVLKLREAEAEHAAAQRRLAELREALEEASPKGAVDAAPPRRQEVQVRGSLAARRSLGMKKRSPAAMARLSAARQGSKGPGATTAPATKKAPATPSSPDSSSGRNEALNTEPLPDARRAGSSKPSAPQVPPKSALAAKKKLGLKKKSTAALARLASMRQRQEAPRASGGTVSSSAEEQRSATKDDCSPLAYGGDVAPSSTSNQGPSDDPGPADILAGSNDAAPYQAGAPMDRYKMMRIKVMPLMRSWVTRPDPVGEFAALGNLSTAQAEEVYITYEEDETDDQRDEDFCHTFTDEKKIFVMSDCTGESAAKTVRGALMQFENCNGVTMKPSMVVFRFLNDERKAVAIVERASQENAMVVFTLVDPQMVNTVKAACHFYHVQCQDLWCDLLDSMAAHLEAAPLRIPGGMQPGTATVPKPSRLGRDYFKLISAVEYTRRMDDGANPHEWKDADLLILGVSRSGKTPLCIYLGQRGYKVANLPLVPKLPIPKELFEVDQRKIVGLLLDPTVLQAIRANRMESMGVGDEKSDYNQLSKVRQEVNWVKQFYAGNPEWLVLDQTYQSVEETSARILRVMSERLGKEDSKWSQEISGDMLEIIR